MFERLRIAYHSLFLKHIPYEYHLVLAKYNDYYNGLSEPLQKVFRERVYISSRFIKFSPVKFRKVTREMRVLITSALVQITFGLDKFVMKKFKKVYIVPNTYSFAQYPALLGHVDHDKSVIAMSWPSVKEGFVIPDDAMNVALHEIAHALQGENEERYLFNKFFQEVNMRRWEKQGAKEIYAIRSQRHNFLREYAGQNIFELFAVSIECFFEQSEEFKAKVPELYTLMTQLLNQDPTRRKNPVLLKRDQLTDLRK